LSSCEIEYMTLFEAAKEAIWIRRFLNELNFRNDQLVLIFADNKSAIDLRLAAGLGFGHVGQPDPIQS
jgi:hypothetical protein